ncbi:PstA family ABC transporter permease [Calycomorphotria hydatis]|uniref:Phosphate transport system permease protein PstA n=1 Tax=Calycomorphotria hydatis TaxID=2528027 RepID=A0A517T712_9PLAN|nr:ABC transporter permease subunit [Calycomorphotria hydatis]QDT64163.1 Phosphate transport system permease protein PstA [Calycomorphotria hydatis]
MADSSPSTTTASKPTSRWRRRAHGRASAFTTMIARSEPMLWISGGALSVCVFMIVLLLLYLIVQGGRTFWPGEIYEVPLQGESESFLWGEVAERSGLLKPGYVLTEQIASLLPEDKQEKAEKLLGGKDRVILDQTLYRIDNKDLWGEPFQYVTDLERSNEPITTPEWIVVAERVEWGRFIGVPQTFSVMHPREIAGEEQQLQAIQNFLAANMYRLNEEQTTSLSSATEAVDQALNQLRVENTHSFLRNFSAKNGPSEWIAELESGDAVPLSELPEHPVVTSMMQQWNGEKEAWQEFEKVHDSLKERRDERIHLEKYDIGALNRKTEHARMDVLEAQLDSGQPAERVRLAVQNFDFQIADLMKSIQTNNELAAAFTRKFGTEYPQAVNAFKQLVEISNVEIQEAAEAPRKSRDEMLAKLSGEALDAVEEYREIEKQTSEKSADIRREINMLVEENDRYRLTLKSARGEEKELRAAGIVRAYPANQLDWSGRLGVYMSRWWEFLTEDPREANTEGGVLPAIWGTVAMTLVMTVVVVPFGVLAALYLREYAKAGFVVSLIRIAVNNLAGVPSIVFGVFGLGFLIYQIGAFVDGGPQSIGVQPWGSGMWFAALSIWGVLAVAGIILWATILRGVWKRGSTAMQTGCFLLTMLWCACIVGGGVALIGHVPFFDGFYRASPGPVFGAGGLLWASLTLALLTLPVVIVATEEALSSVPNTMREGSYACGASKWQTIRRIVLPRALPGILTGTILAIARGAGEVAPLMLVGAVKIAPELPVDFEFPFIHPERRFMHLGFHIFDLGFQSPDSEAAKPMVFTTTLLLIVLVAALNIVAIALRSRLRKKFAGNEF